MDNSNKAIAKRINKELNIRGWGQTELLKRLIRFKHPEFSDSQIYIEVNTKKGNFSTALKGDKNRSIAKEDLYYISKIFKVSLEYIWFGEKNKSGFIPSGARYAAYQDSEEEYRSYVSNIDKEWTIKSDDECGYNIFQYLGQFSSINGYRFFTKNYNLHFDYEIYNQLEFVCSNGHRESCANYGDEDSVAFGLINTLAEYNDTKTFRAIFFDNSSLKRFYPYQGTNTKDSFNDNFLEIVLQTESFLELLLETKKVDLHSLYEKYDKNEIRFFVEPMFYETLFYALKHEEEYEEQLLKMLRFALEHNKLQYEFMKKHVVENKYVLSDAVISGNYSKYLKTDYNTLLGNVVVINEQTSNNKLNKIIKEIEKYSFNMTHIINAQEKTNEAIKIAIPDNPLFMELHKNALKAEVSFVPIMVYNDEEFVFFQYHETGDINFDDIEQLRLIMDYLNKAQELVAPKKNKALVHGDLSNRVLIKDKEEVVGLSGWQKCHYGSKYEDRSVLLSNINLFYPRDDFCERIMEKFDVISQGFSDEEKLQLVDATIDLLKDKTRLAVENKTKDYREPFWYKEQSARLEFFRDYFLNK